ncbi:MAG: hypothetical protein SFV55_06110 [Haliscomenobacter sp.]|uniref:hypothetical protein n=1 Tax=Haliscomenobacter sp. TaxID=2717303 RepID=UPI0029B8C190|nr:hypothetical protein [Haliscomenobacter sp.]MDX2067980.1 hypothetical protein [Haliscomenobacter sp.]
MNKRSMILLMALFLLLGCQKETEGPTEGVLIRIENTSRYTFQDIKVSITEEKLYGTLSPRESSNYQAYSKAYRYAYIELKIRNKLYVLQPIDYFGEEELKEGKYTYQLDVEDTSSQSRRLDLTFKKD